MKFNVGDRVRIKSWETLVEEFGIDDWGYIPCKFAFTEEMKYLCGRTAKIEKIVNTRDGKSELKLENWNINPNSQYTYSTDMVEHYEKNYTENFR